MYPPSSEKAREETMSVCPSSVMTDSYGITTGLSFAITGLSGVYAGLSGVTVGLSGVYAGSFFVLTDSLITVDLFQQ